MAKHIVPVFDHWPVNLVQTQSGEPEGTPPAAAPPVLKARPGRTVTEAGAAGARAGRGARQP